MGGCIMKKLGIVLALCILLLPALSLNVSSQETGDSPIGISYIEKGWFKTSGECFINNYTIQQFTTKSKDEFEVKLKKQEGLEENNNKDNNLSSIPIRLYKRGVYNEATGDFNYILVDSKDFNLKTKEEDVVTFKLPDGSIYDDYRIEIGFGTVTYDGATDIIEVTGGSVAVPITFEQVYQADVTNSWNQIYKYNDSVYCVNCSIYIGNATDDGFLSVIGANVINVKDYAAWAFFFKVIDDRGYLYISDSLFDNINPGKQVIQFIHNMNYTYCYNTTFMGSNDYSDMMVRHQDTDATDMFYFERCSFYDCKVRTIGSQYMSTFESCSFVGSNYAFEQSNQVNIYNCTFNSMSYGFYELAGNVSDCVFRDIDYYYSMYGSPAIVHNAIDIVTDIRDNQFRVKWQAAPCGIVYRYNTFNLRTQPYAKVILKNCTGSEIFNVNADVDGVISEYTVLVTTHKSTYGEYGYLANTPFTLLINRTGYITYNSTFNNSFEKMNYIINLTANPVWDYSQTLLWIVKNITGTTVLKLSEDGNLAIAGEIYELTNTPPDASTVAFKINDTLWLTKSGDLYIEGELTQEGKANFGFNLVAVSVGCLYLALAIIYIKLKKRR